MIPKTAELFDLSHTLAAPLLLECEYPWEALPKIKDFILSLAKTLSEDDYYKVCDDVWIAKSAKIAPSALICGPTIIGENTEVRHCAFIRGSALVGADCVVGNSVELKNVILFDKVQVPHFNYVGDSILGYKAHMGAGSVTSNVKSDGSLVVFHGPDAEHPTGLKKFGAILGDHVEIGCNTVLNPGTIIGKNSSVYPLSCVRGFVPTNSIYKTGGVIAAKN